MIIRDYALHPSVMRKEDPNWRFALSANPTTEGVILRIADDQGNEGFGYASATPHMGAIRSALETQLEFFRPHVVGREPCRRIVDKAAGRDAAREGHAARSQRPPWPAAPRPLPGRA